jgi:hypothetical protein
MQSAAYGSLLTRWWLPQMLAILLFLTPVYGDEQAPAAPQPPTQPAQTTPAPPQTPPANPAPATPQAIPMAPLPTIKGLKILVLAGNHAMNDLERKVMAPLVVQVLDVNDRPMQGAEVVFRFPLNGPGATFPGAKNSQIVRTNGTGEAAALNWMANGEVGSFDVHVTATYGNQTGETTVQMSNVTRVVDQARIGHKQASHWYSSKWVKIALIAGAAGAVVGIVLATRGGGSTTSATHTITITPGLPSVGQ